MGRAYTEFQARNKRRAARLAEEKANTPWNMFSRDFYEDIEGSDLWEKAAELGIWGSGTSGGGLADRLIDFLPEVALGRNKGKKNEARDVRNYWAMAADKMAMGNLDSEEELELLIKTYEDANISKMDSANDVAAFQEAYTRNQFQDNYMDRAGGDFHELWTDFAEQAGLETPEGGWVLPDEWGLDSSGRGNNNNNNDGEVEWDRPPWMPEWADDWGRGGEDTNPYWGNPMSWGGGQQPNVNPGAYQYASPFIPGGPGWGGYNPGSAASSYPWASAPQRAAGHSFTPTGGW